MRDVHMLIRSCLFYYQFCASIPLQMGTDGLAACGTRFRSARERPPTYGGGGRPAGRLPPPRPSATSSKPTVDAINNKNVLPFRVDYIKTMDAEPDIDDKHVWDIGWENTCMAPQRIEQITRYIRSDPDVSSHQSHLKIHQNLKIPPDVGHRSSTSGGIAVHGG